MPRPVKNIITIGTKYTRLTVISKTEKPKYFLCKCDCGAIKEVRKDHLYSGKTLSCGCLHKELSSARTDTLHKANIKHNNSRSLTYGIWSNIKQRCGNPSNKFYSHYGARGIQVCDRWLESYENFLADMGEQPKKMTLERIDNEKGYSPDNCKWATRKEQSNNTRANRRLEHDGKNLTVTQWAIEKGVHRNTLNERLRSGWSVKQALDTPFVKRCRRIEE